MFPAITGAHIRAHTPAPAPAAIAPGRLLNKVFTFADAAMMFYLDVVDENRRRQWKRTSFITAILQYIYFDELCALFIAKKKIGESHRSNICAFSHIAHQSCDVHTYAFKQLLNSLFLYFYFWYLLIVVLSSVIVVVTAWAQAFHRSTPSPRKLNYRTLFVCSCRRRVRQRPTRRRTNGWTATVTHHTPATQQTSNAGERKNETLLMISLFGICCVPRSLLPTNTIVATMHDTPPRVCIALLAASESKLPLPCALSKYYYLTGVGRQDCAADCNGACIAVWLPAASAANIPSPIL